MKEPIAITAVHLFLSGADVVVAVEVDGRWVPVIRERADGCYSHIVESGGIRKCAEPIANLIARSSIGGALDDIKERGIDAHLADLEKERRR